MSCFFCSLGQFFIMRWYTYIILTTLLLIFAALLNLGPLITKIAVEKTKKTIEKDIDIEHIYVNPWTLTYQAHNVNIYQIGNTAPVLHIKTLIINITLSSLFTKTVTLNQVKLIKPILFSTHNITKNITSVNFIKTIDYILKKKQI